MNETTEQNPWTTKPHALQLGWVMTSQGLRMRWTLRPVLVDSKWTLRPESMIDSQLGDQQTAHTRPVAAAVRAA